MKNILKQVKELLDNDNSILLLSNRIDEINLKNNIIYLPESDPVKCTELEDGRIMISDIGYGRVFSITYGNRDLFMNNFLMITDGDDCHVEVTNIEFKNIHVNFHKTIYEESK